MSQPKCPFEHIPAQEAEQIAEITALTVKRLDARYKSPQPVLRGVHPKSHGCVSATFTVNADIESDYRVGLFKNPGQQFRAHIRFSNAAALDGPDIDSAGKHGSRGMAIKVLDVGGDVLSKDDGAHNQDFLMINQDVFAFANTEDYLRLTRILDQNNDDPSRFFATLPSLSNPALTPAEKQEIMRAAGLSPDAVTRMITSATIAGIISKMAVTNPLGTQYFGAAPFLFGPERVMKFSAVPCQIVPPTDIPQPPGYDYLRQVLTQTMQQQGDLQFDFMVQVRPGGDGVELGIEDASSTWGQSFEPVAKISIHRPQPDVDSDAHKAQCENLSFSPWHSLVAHQPIGSINRLRKAVYEASSDRRHRR